jgi:CubicO group peptidase (beta-lactamase class C family)
MEMLLLKKAIFIFFVIIGLLIGFRVDRSFADQLDSKYWPTKEWRTAIPKSQDMDSTYLEKMNRYLEINCPLIRSILVIRRGYIVFEKYYSGHLNSTQPIFSATKSITSALIGIALDKGYIRDIDQKLVAFFPEFATEDNDSRLKDVTIRHLLTMSAGFSANLRGSRSMKGCFQERIVTKPGSKAYYNSSSSHLLSGIISKSTKMSTLEFAYQQLFKPLGIPKPDWYTGYDGYNMGGTGLSMRSRDMVKIGYLYLQNGVWDNNQIISSEWIKQSTKKQIAIKLNQEESSYGYQWWVGSFEGHSFFSAFGYKSIIVNS